jgi:hypothetical protein
MTYQSKLRLAPCQCAVSWYTSRRPPRPSETLSAYTNRARTLWTELTTTGVEILATELTEVVLAGLLKDYETRDVLHTMESPLDLNSILPKLLVDRDSPGQAG